MYRKLGNAGTVCLRCVISRPTLRKWLKRYKERGFEGLKEKSRRPFCWPAQKVTPALETLILKLREQRKIGVKRIRTELRRLYGSGLSLATIHKVLKKNQVGSLPKYRRTSRAAKQYSRSVPGEQVQMDVCKIAPGLYQYTAVDDCTRYKVVALYPRRTAANSIKFLEKAMEEMPFPIQRIQTDRGQEFFAYCFQEQLMDWAIKFRPIRPRAPHLNGKVERAQRTALEEFWATVDRRAENLGDLLQEWQHYYNWERPHGSLTGKTPIDRLCECVDKIPLTEEVCANYEPEKEGFRERDYRFDSRLKKLKQSV